MITILRTLTHKSIIGFGRSDIRILAVQELIHLSRQYELVRMYYGLGKISFTEEVLNDIGIKPEWRIKKPGKDHEALSKYRLLIIDTLRAKDEAGGLGRMGLKLANKQKQQNRLNVRGRNNIRECKNMMQRRNHGHLK